MEVIMMYEEIGSYDAKTKLPEILRRVEAGETFTITNRGRAVAQLRPSAEAAQQQIATAVNSLLRMQAAPVSDDDFNAMKTAGRR